MVTKTGLQSPDRAAEDPSASRPESGPSAGTSAQPSPLPTEDDAAMPTDDEADDQQRKIDPVHMAWIEFSPGFREKLSRVRPPAIPPDELFDTLPPNQKRASPSATRSGSEADPGGDAHGRTTAGDAKVPGLTTTTLMLSRPLDAKLGYIVIGALIVAIALGAWWAASSGPSRAPSNAATSIAQVPNTAPIPTQQVITPQSSTAATKSSSSTSASPASAVQSAPASSRPVPTATHSSRSTPTPSASPRTASSSTDPNWFHIKE